MLSNSGGACVCSCRRTFEPFGGLKPAVNAAKTDKAGDELLEMNGFDGDVMTGDPDYVTPQVKDLELVFVAWDVLYWRQQASNLSSSLLSLLHMPCTHRLWCSLPGLASTVGHAAVAAYRLRWPCLHHVLPLPSWPSSAQGSML